MPSFPVNTAVLLAVSTLSAIATGIVGVPSAVLAVLAWRRHATDPDAARTRTRTGWLVYVVNLALGAVLLVPFYIWAANAR